MRREPREEIDEDGGNAPFRAIGEPVAVSVPMAALVRQFCPDEERVRVNALLSLRSNLHITRVIIGLGRHRVRDRIAAREDPARGNCSELEASRQAP